MKKNKRTFNSKSVFLSDGQKVTGTWEQRFGEILIKNDVEFVAHPKPPLKYIVTRTGGIHKYYPDFYLIEEDVFVEITPAFALDRRGGEKRRKLKRVQDQNPDISLLILTEVELEELGAL